MIGAGGMGQTFCAADEQTGGEVALKAMNFSKLTNWKAYELFKREIEVLKSLRWPLVPHYVDSFEAVVNGETLWVLAQEYDAASDLYTLGVTILFLLTGKGPTEFKLKKLRLDYRSHVNFPKDLRVLLDRMIEADHGARLGSAREALRMLKRIGIESETSGRGSVEVPPAQVRALAESGKREKDKNCTTNLGRVQEQKIQEIGKSGDWIARAIAERKFVERPEKK